MGYQQPIYEFNFVKRGLNQNEFEACLTSKVNALLGQPTLIEGIKTIKDDAIKQVRRKVCIQENKTRPHLDQRSKEAVNNHEQLGIIRDKKDIPKKHKNVKCKQGQQRKDKKWNKDLHKEQRTLFEVNLPGFGPAFNLPPAITVNDKGFLVRPDADDNIFKLNGTQFCDEIDKISVKFLQKLKGLKDDGPDKYTMQQIEDLRLKLEPVYETCKKILVGRIGVDWAIDNNLMSGDGLKAWRDHVMVIISFSALMAVAEMIFSVLQKWEEKKRKKGKKIFPFPYIAVAVAVAVAAVAVVASTRT